MADTALARELDAERAHAIRTLLARPLLDADHDADGYTAVVRHRTWLVDWFETACGWHLVVDAQGSFARLHKRRAAPDPTRPLRRLRGASGPFDRRRYELLCRICAELVSPPVTTLGILAGQLVTATGHAAGDRFDTSLRRERAAFVDALLVLADLGVVRISGGDVDAYVDDPDGNAILTTDVSRLHQMLSSGDPPSRLDTDSPAEAIEQLSAEHRYRTDPDAGPVDDSQRNRHLRHHLARRVLDDPVVHRDELTDDEAAYLDSISGRQWLRDRVTDAELHAEVRSEGVLAVDPTATTTDVRFPAPGGNVWQVALLLVDELGVDGDGGRRPVDRSMTELEAAVAALLRAHPRWAKQYRDDTGATRLAGQAVDLLAALGLVRRRGDVVQPRPAIARYRAADPTVVEPTVVEPTVVEPSLWSTGGDRDG